MKARRRAVTILLVAGALAVGGFLFHLHSRQTQLQGKVILKGIPPPEIPIQLDTASARLHPRGLTTRHYRVAQDGGLANVLVYIKEGLNGQTFAPPGKDATIEFRRCQFEPYVIGVRTNQSIAFRNSDPFLQNVHCTPKANGNRESNAALVPLTTDFRTIVRELIKFRWPWRGPRIRRSFPAPEIFVRLKCDVHPWEFGYVAVLEHPFFAISDKHGNFHFPPGLPPGKYTLEARHLKAGMVTQDVTVVEGEKKTVNFTLEVAARP